MVNTRPPMLSHLFLLLLFFIYNDQQYCVSHYVCTDLSQRRFCACGGKSAQEMFNEVGHLAKRKFRMEESSFWRLHSIIRPDIDNYFSLSSKSTNSNRIPSSLRLCAALRFFAGGSALDIFIDAGMGYTLLSSTVFGPSSTASTKKSKLNLKFPTHEEQHPLASEFYKKSGAKFDKCMRCINGIVIWTIKPSRQYCKKVFIGKKSFFCERKNKFGFNLETICDHKLRFLWEDLSFSASASGYVAFTSSRFSVTII